MLVPLLYARAIYKHGDAYGDAYGVANDYPYVGKHSYACDRDPGLCRNCDASSHGGLCGHSGTGNLDTAPYGYSPSYENIGPAFYENAYTDAPAQSDTDFETYEHQDRGRYEYTDPYADPCTALDLDADRNAQAGCPPDPNARAFPDDDPYAYTAPDLDADIYRDVTTDPNVYIDDDSHADRHADACTTRHAHNDTHANGHTDDRDIRRNESHRTHRRRYEYRTCRNEDSMIILFGSPLYQIIVLSVITLNVMYWIVWVYKNRNRWGFAVPPLLWWINLLAYNIASILFRYTTYQLRLEALIVWNTILIWQAGVLITGVGVVFLRKKETTR